MITKSLLVQCRCHLRVYGAGRICQRSTAVSRSQCSKKVAVAARVWNTSRRSFSVTQTDREHQGHHQIGYSDEMACHIRSCLTQPGEQVTEMQMRHTGFTIAFLGTGGGMPTTLRNTSATILRLGGMSFLFDAGEGLQRQLAFSKLPVSQINKIFITHLHGDHLFGLPALLLHLRTATENKSHAVHIYGPPGLHTYIAANLALSCSAFASLTVVVHELVGGTFEGGPNGKYWGKGEHKKNIFLDSYPEMSSRWLVKKKTEQNDDGTWTIENPQDVSVDESGDELTASNDVNTGSSRRLHISAAEVTHLPGVQTFGFVVQEVEPPRKIDQAKAIKLGVRPGRKYRLLKNGFPVMSDDNSRQIEPESVLLDATTRARKFALVGDNCGLSPAMARLCQDADVLVHEAAITEENSSAALTRGHSSAEMTGRVAKSVNARVLVLNHIAPAMSKGIRDLAEQVKRTNEGVSRVVVSHDFMELVVPRLGFGEKREEEEGLVEDVATTAAH